MERQEKDLQSILGQILKREGGGSWWIHSRYRLTSTCCDWSACWPLAPSTHRQPDDLPALRPQRVVHHRPCTYTDICLSLSVFFSLSRSLSRSACIFRSSRVLRLLICQFPRSAQTARLYVIEVGLWLVLVLGGAFGVDLANLLEGAG